MCVCVFMRIHDICKLLGLNVQFSQNTFPSFVRILPRILTEIVVYVYVCNNVKRLLLVRINLHRLLVSAC